MGVIEYEARIWERLRGIIYYCGEYMGPDFRYIWLRCGCDLAALRLYLPVLVLCLRRDILVDGARRFLPGSCFFFLF